MSFKKALSLVGGEVVDQLDGRTGVTPAVSLADAEVYDTGVSAYTGHVYIETESDGAIIPCHVAAGVEVVGDVIGSSEFSNAKDTADKVNVYVEGGTIQIQNSTGDVVSIKARLF